MKPRLQNDDSAPEVNQELAAAKNSVVHLSDARRLTRRRDETPHPALAKEIEEARDLLDRGQSSEAESRLRRIIMTAGGGDKAPLLARARCTLSVALEMLGRYPESLETVQMYETPESRAHLDAETATSLRVRIGLAYNYTGDHPKAIALLNAAQRETSEAGSDAQMGAVYEALARIYRSIAEYTIARDHAHKALDHYRRTGDWRGLAEAYFSIALADMHEGDYDAGLENFKQATTLV
ncbi:MAG: hypothetical protein H0V88_06100, partial [Pyrinomonadaceae bacterium]|nr:hypothetical protein [Pyrinomonadaceae bacterium]